MKKLTSHRRPSRKQAATLAVYARERAISTLAVAFFVLAFLTYTYFLCVSVVNVVMRQEIDTEIARVSNDITKLEARYIDAQARVTKEEATLRGFATSNEKVYVARDPESLVLRTYDES